MDTLLKKIHKNPLTIKKIQLDISDTYIPKEIAKCENLEQLDISYSEVDKIPSFVAKLPKLKRLAFNGCEQLDFPDNLNEYTSLVKLEAHCASKGALSKCFKLENLESLKIDGKKIKNIPDSIQKLKNLKELSLLDTSITILPIEISHLKKLQYFQNNQPTYHEIKAIDLNQFIEVLAQCQNLKKLDLSQNSISKIPNTISKLISIQSLNLSENELTKLPNELYMLNNLTVLDLGANELKELPKGIGNLKALKILKLNSNWSNKFDANNLMNEIHLLENLELLHLWSCQSVNKIPQAIAKCRKLKEIDLDNNLLKDLPESILKMKQLKKLRITTNHLNEEIKEKLKKELTQTKLLLD